MRPDERDAGGLLEGKSLEAYLRDRVRQLALERALELVGEAARRVSRKLQSAHPEIDWRGIIGQRNVLAHEYGVIDQARLYRTGTASVPRLVAVLTKVLEEDRSAHLPAR